MAQSFVEIVHTAVDTLKTHLARAIEYSVRQLCDQYQCGPEQLTLERYGPFPTRFMVYKECPGNGCVIEVLEDDAGMKVIVDHVIISVNDVTQAPDIVRLEDLKINTRVKH